MKAAPLASLFLFLITALLPAQGPLTPPGAPAPTMKSLDQIESRTPIPASPATPVNGPHFTISSPGSYYLTGNVTVDHGHGIVISSSDVTLDLNGFRISSTNTSAGNGTAIAISSGGRSRITIRNGSIASGSTVEPGNGSVQSQGFSRGISGETSVNQVLVENIHVYGCSSAGINLGYDGNIAYQGIVRNCTVKHCNNGIVAQDVVDSSASLSGEYGIYAQNATNCSSAGSYTYGIYVLGNATNCKANGRMYGIFCAGNANNCHGTGDSSGNGLSCAGNATNCTGISNAGSGLTCVGNATNCTGSSDSGAFGMNVAGTASFCRGKRNGGVAIQATIAIGCTVDGTGTVTSAQKHLGTP